MENPLPDYFEFLGNAFEASDAVDDFDVNDTNRAEFQELVDEQYRTSKQLIEFIVANEEKLLRFLFEM